MSESFVDACEEAGEVVDASEHSFGEEAQAVIEEEEKAPPQQGLHTAVTNMSSKKGKKPKTLGDMVVAALVTLNDRPPGSSRQAIKKFIKAEFGKDDKAGALKRAITKLVASKKLIQTGQSFMLMPRPTQSVSQ